MVTLIIPDVHEDHLTVERILAAYPAMDRYIWLGDFFDSFETPQDPARAVACAQIVKRLIHDPKHVFLLGNHDAHYRWVGNFICSGYVYAKRQAIAKVLTEADWEPFRFFTFEQGWLLSHAGFHRTMVPRGRRFTPEILASLEGDALSDAATGITQHPWLRVGWSRGGNYEAGGPLWLDWREEFKPLYSVSQIVGHTPGLEVRSVGQNYCLDTALRHVGILEHGNLRVQPVAQLVEVIDKQVVS